MSRRRLRPVTDRKTAILDAAIAVIARQGVRGLRVEEVAKQAGVAVSLLYYHFGTRTGLVRATLDHANERAAAPARDLRATTGLVAVTTMLLAEIDDIPDVRETSVVWGEVAASAVFDPDLAIQLKAANDAWVSLMTQWIAVGVEDGSIRAEVDVAAAAERLTALVDGLSSRWLADLVTVERARDLLAESIGDTLWPIS